MAQNWRQYLDEDYEEDLVRVEKIIHPKRTQDEKPPKKEPQKNTK